MNKKNTEQLCLWNMILNYIDGNDVDSEDINELKKDLDRVFQKAADVIDEKNVEIAQLTIDLAQKDENIRRLEKTIEDLEDEVLNLRLNSH